MKNYSLFQVGDDALERNMLALFADDHRRLALQIAHIAEFDARRLYAREGYSSMFEYCIQRALFSDDAALKRIRAARAARKHPILYRALADGRLHLSAIVMLTPRLTDENAGFLVAAATRKTVAEIGQLIARHFPKEDVALCLRPLAPVAEAGNVVSKPTVAPDSSLASKPVGAAVPPPLPSQTPPPPAFGPRITPLSPGRFETRFTMGQETHQIMHHLEQLLGRRVTSEDLNAALALGFKSMIVTVEKRRFAATDKPRAQRRPAKGRHIPAEVKRAIVKRDGNRCTFVAANSRRCEARGRLEFDHIEPVARGGKSTVANLRLRCRAHNQYEAEQVFGEGFMHTKREQSRATAGGLAASAIPAHAAPAPALTDPKPGAAQQSDDLDLSPWLTRLGFRREEVRRAAAHCNSLPDAPLEQRVRAALSFLRPPARVSGAATGAARAGYM